jgi:glycosyltransferase involved in cell wall biosynthesis
MKCIAIIINNLGIGGAERYVFDSVIELDKQGYTVQLITLLPERDQTFLTEDLKSKTNHKCVLAKGLFDYSAIRNIAKILKNSNADVVCTHLWLSNVLGRIAALRAGIKNVFSFEHNVSTIKSWKQKILDRYLVRLTKYIVAVSSTVRKTLIADGIQEKKIVVLETAINTTKFEGLSSNDRKNTRKNMGLKDSDFVYLFVGSLTEQKNILNIIKAFNTLEKGHLLIAGDGGLRDHAEKIAKRNISILGIVHNVPELMNAADVLVFVSRWEGLGLVAVEALLSGLPVIASGDYRSATAEFIKNKENGLLVSNPEDVEEIADAMEKLQIDQNLYLALKKQTANIRKDFSIEKNIKQLVLYAKE